MPRAHDLRPRSVRAPPDMDMGGMMTLTGAKAMVWDFDQRFILGVRHMFAAGAVTNLALHGGQVFDVGHSRAAGFAVAGDVAADAVEVEFFVLARERRVRGGV